MAAVQVDTATGRAILSLSAFDEDVGDAMCRVRYNADQIVRDTTKSGIMRSDGTYIMGLVAHVAFFVHTLHNKQYLICRYATGETESVVAMTHNVKSTHVCNVYNCIVLGYGITDTTVRDITVNMRLALESITPSSVSHTNNKLYVRYEEVPSEGVEIPPTDKLDVLLRRCAHILSQ